MAPTEAAYLAGLLDGEGYFSFRRTQNSSRGYKYKSYELRVTLVMTSEDLLREVSDMVPWGVGTVGPNKRTLAPNHSPSFRLTWHGAAATEVARSIAPYVRLKRRHVDLILALASLKEMAESERSGRGRRFPSWLHEWMQVMAEEFSILNQRGLRAS